MAEKRAARRRTKAKTKPTERVVGLVCRKLMDPDTGELVKAFVPMHRIDRDICNERHFRDGDQLIADLFKDRNMRFHRKAHALAKFVKENVERYTHLTTHATLKRLQREAQVECDEETIVVMGEEVAILKPRSLNMVDMDEAQFEAVWNGIVGYICREILPTWDEAQVEAAVEFWADDQC